MTHTHLPNLGGTVGRILTRAADEARPRGSTDGGKGRPDASGMTRTTTRPSTAMIETLPMFDAPDERSQTSPSSARLDEHGTAEDAPLKRAESGLPAVLDVETAGRLLGLGRSAAYQLVKDGAWPSPVLRLGRRWRVLTAPLLALLEIEGAETSAVDATLRPSPTVPATSWRDRSEQR